MNIIPLFQGFELPEENWSKLPHDLINALPQVTSLAELKVILYILRHTWGYREFDAPKTITGDEFANGRKKTDGSRIDGGIGMSEPSVRTGIKNAIEHGFISACVDDADAARIEKSYSLAMRTVIQGVKSLPPEGKELTLRPKTSYPRSEKDTLGKKLKKENVPQEIHPYIQTWITVRGIDQINIGAPVYTKEDTACAKRMAKWDSPPTEEEIKTAITSSPSKKYKFTWLASDIPEIRIARLPKPTPSAAPPPPAEPVFKEREVPLTPEQAAERVAEYTRLMAEMTAKIVSKPVRAA